MKSGSGSIKCCSFINKANLGLPLTSLRIQNAIIISLRAEYIIEIELRKIKFSHQRLPYKGSNNDSEGRNILVS